MNNLLDIQKHTYRKILREFIMARSYKELPEKPGIYFVIDRHDKKFPVHYIGKAKNLRSRWQNHSYRGQIETGHKIIYYTTDYRDLSLDEAFYILLFEPEGNTTITISNYPRLRDRKFNDGYPQSHWMLKELYETDFYNRSIKSYASSNVNKVPIL